jgi:hypothetical protein
MVQWLRSSLDDLGAHFSRKEQCSAGVPEAVEADGARPNIKQQRLEAPLVYVAGVKEPTNLCSEYEILIAVEGTCAGGQIRRTGIQLASPCAPWVSLVTGDEVGGSSPLVGSLFSRILLADDTEAREG